MRLYLMLAVGLILSLGPTLAQPLRDKAPTLPPASPMTAPLVEKFELTNGIKVWLIRRPQVPMLSFSVLLDAGQDQDPEGQFGLASFTADLLKEGAAGRTALEVSDALEILGAELATGSARDYATISLSVPSARFSEALDIVSDLARRPDFPPQEVERLRAERLTDLLEARDQPSALVDAVFSATLYPPTHRYSTRADGKEAFLKSLQREQVLEFHKTYYRPDRATILLAGDVSREQAESLLQAKFGDWTGQGESVAPTFPTVKPVTSRRVLLVDKPGAAQTTIRIGRVGVARNTADYYPLRVLETVLGGSFTSRLNQNLREKNGYTYGARSTFVMPKQPGPFFAGADVQTDKTGPALEEFFRELEAITEPIPEAELNKAKNYLALSFPQAFETNDDLVSMLRAVVVYGLPLEYFESFMSRIQKVTAAQVQEVAKKYVTPEQMVIVLVGDKAQVLPQLENLQLGPVEIVEPDF